MDFTVIRLTYRGGCTQGDIDSPIIFNLIIDAVLRMWHESPAYKQTIACFYADDGLLENNKVAHLQHDLDYIIELFARVGLQANEVKTKFMVVRGAKAPPALTPSAYQAMTTRYQGGTRRNADYNTWRTTVVQCPVCNKSLQNASLKRHLEQQHDTTTPTYQCRPTEETGHYTIRTLEKGNFTQCPVMGCTGGGKDKFSMYRHFCFKHNSAMLTIQEDGHLPKCDKCGMHTKNITRHQKTATCKRLQVRRTNEEKQDEQARAELVKFTVNGKEVERVKYFRYLGRILSENDDDTKCILDNLRRARQRWNSISRILKREGANAVCMSRFYLTVVQAVLLYGAESWTISKRNMMLLQSFHRRATRYMTGQHILKVGDTWKYPDHNRLLKKCKLFGIETYIERRRGTLRKYLEEYRGELLEDAIGTN